MLTTESKSGSRRGEWRRAEVAAALFALLGVCLSLGGCTPESQPRNAEAVDAVAGVAEASAQEEEAVASPRVTPTSLSAGAGGGPYETASVHEGRTPSLAWDAAGTLWAVFEKDGHVYVARSGDEGETFERTVRITEVEEPIETNGESRPKIAIGTAGELYVSWTKKLERRFTGEVRFSRSIDGGESYEPPRTINDDGLAVGHRLDSLLVDERGDVYLSWIDKRDRHAARERGESYRAAALYYAVSTDGGATFAPNALVEPHACECCRIAMAPAAEAGVAILWRHVFEPNIRDHAFTIVDADGPRGEAIRAGFAGWQLEGCPHHGPAMDRGADGFHAVWFSAAGGEPRIHYGRVSGGDGTVDRIVRLADERAVHADLVEHGGELVAVWKEVGDDRTRVYLRRSTDGGVTWNEPAALAETSGGSDHPLLVEGDLGVLLGWYTEAEGLRVVPI